MTELNATAATRAREAGAHAMTDVTGFGLLGHLHELCTASGLAARIDAHAVPTIPGAHELAADERCVAGGTRRNAEHVEDFVEWGATVSTAERVLLTDAMTSGGLLVAVPRSTAASLEATVIGELVAGAPGRIIVR